MVRASDVAEGRVIRLGDVCSGQTRLSGPVPSISAKDS